MNDRRKPIIFSRNLDPFPRAKDTGSLSILPIVPALLGQRGHTVPLPTFPWDNAEKATGMRLYARLKTIQRGYTRNVISGLQILASGSNRTQRCVCHRENIFIT